MMENLILKYKRVKMGVDEEEIARLAHLTKDSYISIENNTVEPRLSNMVGISNVIGATIDELFD